MDLRPVTCDGQHHLGFGSQGRWVQIQSVIEHRFLPLLLWPTLSWTEK